MNELTTEDKINFRMLELEARIAEIEKAIDVTSGGFKRELEREKQDCIRLLDVNKFMLNKIYQPRHKRVIHWKSL